MYPWMTEQLDNEASRSTGDHLKGISSFKTFTFVDSGVNHKKATLHVKIPEIADPGYSMYTWPCAPVLAQYVWKHRVFLQGKHVLEIGSGTALCGVVAARCGADVTLSDSPLFQDSLHNGRESCRVNGLEGVKIVPLTWGLLTPVVLQLPAVNIILGSDCFYDTKDFEDVLVTISFLLKRSPDCQFWCTYQNRSAMRSIQYYLQKWDLAAEEVPVSSFFSEDDFQNFDCPGIDSIHMFVISLKQHNSSESVT